MGGYISIFCCILRQLGETFVSFDLEGCGNATLGRLSTKSWLLSIKIIGDTGRESFQCSSPHRACVRAHTPSPSLSLFHTHTHTHSFNIVVNSYGFDTLNMLIKKFVVFYYTRLIISHSEPLFPAFYPACHTCDHFLSSVPFEPQLVCPPLPQSSLWNPV